MTQLMAALRGCNDDVMTAPSIKLSQSTGFGPHYRVALGPVGGALVYDTR